MAKTLYRFLYVSPPKLSKALDPAFRKTTQSFRRISAKEAGKFRAHAIRILTIRRETPVKTLAARMPFKDRKVERFTVLNGLQPNQILHPGDVVKMVVER